MKPTTWEKPPAHGCKSSLADLYRYTVVRNADKCERFTDRRPRREIVLSADYTVWDNRANREVR